MESFSACSAFFFFLTLVQGIAQINLADYDGSSEMQLRWYTVQVFGSCGPPRARESERAGGAAGDPAQAAAGKTVRAQRHCPPASDACCHWGFSCPERLCTLGVGCSGAQEAVSREGMEVGGFEVCGHHNNGFNADELVIGSDTLMVLKFEPLELHEVARLRPAGTQCVLLATGEQRWVARPSSGAPLSPRRMR